MNILILSNHGIGVSAFFADRALRKLGHAVTLAGPEPAPGPGKALPADWRKCDPEADLPDWIAREGLRPDLALLIEANTGIKFFPRGLERLRVPKAWWALDNHLNFRWHKEYAAAFDWVFFAQKDFVGHAKAAGLDHVNWLPHAIDDEIYRPAGVSQTGSVAFLGNMNLERAVFMDEFSKKVPLKIITGVHLQALPPAYGKFKIALNICAREDLNWRTFLALACGPMLLMQRIHNGLEDLFQDRKHLVIHDITDAADLAKYYLAHDSERTEIAREGQKEVFARHTYIHRMQELLRVVSTAPRAALPDYRVEIGQGLALTHRTIKYCARGRAHLMRAFAAAPFASAAHIAGHAWSYLLEKIWKFKVKEF